MYVIDIRDQLVSEDFQLFKRQATVNKNDQNVEDLLRAYFRQIHHERSEKYIIANYLSLGIETLNMAIAVARLSKGHRVEDITDVEKFDSRYYIATGKDPICILFLACCLRLADEVDITGARTPELLLKLVSPSNLVSKIEWQKHKSTLAVGLDRTRIRIQARCEKPAIQKAILLTAKKIKDTIDLVQKAMLNLPSDLKDKYFIEINDVMAPKIEEIGYLYRDFKFDMDTAAILKILMGERLYKSRYDTCRELLQNSIDTCRLRSKLKANYVQSISIGISKDKTSLWVEDNGMGMDEFIIENYLLKVGRSYYRSTDFDSQYSEIKMSAISEFGIGILSCFMIADSFNVETCIDGGEARRLEISDLGQNVIVRACARQNAGTKVELNLKPDVAKELNDFKLIELVRNYIRHVEIPIRVITSNGNETTVLDAGYDFSIAEAVDPFKLNKINEYELVETRIDPAKSGGINGRIGTILGKTSFESLIPVYWAWRDFKSNFGFGAFGINISQRGIFVTNQMGRRKWYREGWYGELNLEQSSELQLTVARDSFVLSKSSDTIDKVIQDGISELLNGLFAKKWNNLPKESVAGITHNLIEGYTSFGGPSEEYPLTNAMHKTIRGSFIFRVVKKGEIGYSNLEDFLGSIESWLLVPIGLDVPETDIREEAKGIREDCGNENLLLAGPQVSPHGAFEFLANYLGSIYSWRIITSNRNRRSYHEYLMGSTPNVTPHYGFESYSTKVVDFGNSKTLLGTYIELERFLNRDHRFIRKLIPIVGQLQSKQLELVNGFFYEVGERLNHVIGKVSSENFAELQKSQRIVLDMLEEIKYISSQEKEELIIKKEELPGWRYQDK